MMKEHESRTTTWSTSGRPETKSMERRRRRKGRWSSSSLGLLFVVLLALALCPGQSRAEVTRGCSVGLQTPGHTWPAGDIVLEWASNSSLYIQCILNQTHVDAFFPGKNSSDLVFFKGHRQADPASVSIVNESTIALNITDPPPQNEMYYCKLKLDSKVRGKDYEAVCLNKVVVGYKPSEPSNFECVSHNWENMTCTWEPPANYVDTKYLITFKLPGRAGGRKVFACPSYSKPPQQPGKPVHKNICTWDSTTNPIYRQPYEYYFFNLTGENVLGTWSRVYKFHHFANVIPNRPSNLTVVNKTLDTALLHWNVGFPMQTFPPGLHHKVVFRSEWDDPEDWKLIRINDEIHNPKRYYNLTGLHYANAIYDVRVFIKSVLATGDDKWSNFSDVTFRTPPQIPGASPRSTVGSFEIMENNINRDIYLYWQTIPPWLENGNNFTYQVYQVDEKGKRSTIAVEPSELSRSFAKFRGLGHLSNYYFEIASSNEVGVRPEPTKIFIPSRTSIPKEPVAFTKIAFDDEDGLFELSWKPPINGDDAITNYTIFWCENDKDRPYQCMGYLDWKHVPKNVTTHNVTVPHPDKVYQFAIAANTKHASSGMMWASCTVIHNKIVGKMKTVWINRIGSTVIEVGWKLDCSDRIGIIEGFKIYYCPIVSPYNLNCKGPKLNTTIKADLNTIRGEVRGLKPYTTYMIAVAVLSKNGEGQHSDPLYNTTLESPPSNSPSDIMVRNVTNTTMFLEWTKPLNMNGVLRYYIVYYNEFKKSVDEVSHVELTGLQANKNYTISVAACTVECSDKSPPVRVLTDIGIPSKILPPVVRFVNSSQVRVLWDKPTLPAGPLSYYQILSSDGEIQNTTNLESSLAIDCKTEGKEKLYKFQVRAINVAENNEHLFGNWSEAGEGNCFSDGPSYGVWVLIWIIGSISGIAFVFCIAYTSKRLWIKCKAMQDVEVKLPPGLAPNMKLLEKGDQHSRHPSADSIGRNSNPESITSSLTTHHSCVSTDSGAELDLSPNQVATDASNSEKSDQTWESASMRQKGFKPGSKTNIAAEMKLDPYSRIVAGSNELIIASAMTADSKSLTRSTPNLTDNLGFNNSNQAWTSTGYISMPSSEEMSENSSSPVPKDNANLAHYSVVSMPTSTPMRYNKPENETSPLSKTQTETKIKPINPYISLMALDQRNKELKNPQVLDSFQILNDLNLTSANQMASQEKSKPYVQTCFLDFKGSPLSSFEPKQTVTPQPSSSAYLAQNSLAQDLTNKLTPKSSPTHTPTPTATPNSTMKPYVSIASLADPPQMQQKKPIATVLPNIITAPTEPPGEISKAYVPENSYMEGENKGGDIRSESSAFLMPQQSLSSGSFGKMENEQQKKARHYSTLGVETKDEESRPSSSCSSSSSSYTLCLKPDEKQTNSQVGSSPSTKVSGYVSLPEQKCFSKALPQQQMTGSNEHYSKVAALPRTMH